MVRVHYLDLLLCQQHESGLLCLTSDAATSTSSSGSHAAGKRFTFLCALENNQPLVSLRKAAAFPLCSGAASLLLDLLCCLLSFLLSSRCSSLLWLLNSVRWFASYLGFFSEYSARSFPRTFSLWLKSADLLRSLLTELKSNRESILFFLEAKK